MNQFGIVIDDLSHSGDRAAIEALESTERR
jgi:microsomal dipeptidase-like Zn-dependent dipeptidase